MAIEQVGPYHFTIILATLYSTSNTIILEELESQDSADGGGKFNPVSSAIDAIRIIGDLPSIAGILARGRPFAKERVLFVSSLGLEHSRISHPALATPRSKNRMLTPNI